MAIESSNPELTLSTNQVILWWEWRRLLYNGVLLVLGIAAVIGFEILMEKALPPGEDAEEPLGLLILIALYAVAANLCYTLGWLVELFERRKDVELARKHGRRNFWLGLAFSCALTTTPAAYAWWFLATSTHGN